jgi:dTDP-glucose 4,6-dehydratase
MRILVTGGAGFIGSHFAREALNRGAQKVVVLDKLSYAADLTRIDDIKGDVEFIEGSIGDEALLSKIAEDLDTIVNFAAESHVDNSIINPDLFYKSNVLELLPLLRVASSVDARFHQVSTDEVYGDLDLGAGEFEIGRPYNPSSPYSASKAAADHLVRSWGKTFGLKQTISICSNNYGLWQHSEKFIPRQIDLLIAGKPPELYGGGLNERDWIHVDDHVDGIFATLVRGVAGQTYHFGGSNVLSNQEVVGILSDIFDQPRQDVVFISDRLGHDKRYAINFEDSIHALGWRPKERSMRQELEKLVSHRRNFPRILTPKSL